MTNTEWHFTEWSRQMGVLHPGWKEDVMATVATQYFQPRRTLDPQGVLRHYVPTKVLKIFRAKAIAAIEEIERKHLLASDPGYEQRALECAQAGLPTPD